MRPNVLLEECLGLVQDRLGDGRMHVVCELDPAVGELSLDAREMRKALLKEGPAPEKPGQPEESAATMRAWPCCCREPPIIPVAMNWPTPA